ncbi:hypothetical protein Patl1_01796 [Pistacia atlantica]|uniref:Uncharacterized protein n=1 Tax=Pistacia atlantica TaxID=434234 RepID=A0ACC1C9A0_9ROSI|nr:hypothetical protein Patl1_01796 [Pistacia atlantica]
MSCICDFCGVQKSIVYCRSDAACLCLSCDRNVHSANALSKRHSRTLLCERCNSQPALVRCAEERVSLCQSCDWRGHGTSTLASAHKRQTINCYSGCPSASELSSIWSFVLDLPSVGESACEQELGLMSITDNSMKNTWGNNEDTITQNASGGGVETNNMRDADKSRPLQIFTSLICSYAVLEQKFLRSVKMMISMRTSIWMKWIWNLENYEELFGVTLNHSEELFENGGIDSLFGAKEMSAADSNCQGAVAAEGSSIGLVNTMQPACSNAASADSMVSTKTEPIICFTGKQAPSSLSFSGLTGESNAGDYQDCDASSMLLMGEPPWCPPCPETSFTSASRSEAVMRYKEKKKTRKFDKRVRYASRKARADVRKRVKGRFVKAGDAYDYDPLNQTRSC